MEDVLSVIFSHLPLHIVLPVCKLWNRVGKCIIIKPITNDDDMITAIENHDVLAIKKSFTFLDKEICRWFRKICKCGFRELAIQLKDYVDKDTYLEYICHLKDITLIRPNVQITRIKQYIKVGDVNMFLLILPWVRRLREWDLKQAHQLGQHKIFNIMQKVTGLQLPQLDIVSKACMEDDLQTFIENYKGESYLKKVIKYGSVKILNYLLPTLDEKSLYDAFFYSCRRNRQDIAFEISKRIESKDHLTFVARLFEYYELALRVDDGLENRVHIAIEKGDIETVKELYPMYKEDVFSTIICANLSWEMLELLYRGNKEWFVEMVRHHHNNINVVKFAVERVNIDPTIILSWNTNSSIETLEYLLDNGADPTEYFEDFTVRQLYMMLDKGYNVTEYIVKLL